MLVSPFPNNKPHHNSLLTQARALASDVRQAGLSNVAVLGRTQRGTRSPEVEKEVSLSAPRETVSWSSARGDASTGNFAGGLGIWNPTHSSSSAMETAGTTSADSSVSEPRQETTRLPSAAANDDVLSQAELAREAAEQQAAMTAENLKTAENIRKIYDEMWAEIRRSQAQRFQLVMEAMNFANESIMQIHQARMQTSNTHHAAVLAAIIDAPTS